MTDSNLRPIEPLEKAALDSVRRKVDSWGKDNVLARLDLIEASLSELVEEVSVHHTELDGKLRQQAKLMAAKIVTVQKAVQELQILMFGKPEYQLEGLIAEVKRISAALEQAHIERRHLQLTVKVLALLGAGTFGAVLLELALSS